MPSRCPGVKPQQWNHHRRRALPSETTHTQQTQQDSRHQRHVEPRDGEQVHCSRLHERSSHFPRQPRAPSQRHSTQQLHGWIIFWQSAPQGCAPPRLKPFTPRKLLVRRCHRPFRQCVGLQFIVDGPPCQLLFAIKEARSRGMPRLGQYAIHPQMFPFGDRATQGICARHHHPSSSRSPNPVGLGSFNLHQHLKTLTIARSLNTRRGKNCAFHPRNDPGFRHPMS